MKYSGSSIVSTYQVGDEVYIIENDVPVKAVVTKTMSVNNGSGVSVSYKVAGFEKYFQSSEVFADANSIKTEFGNLTDAL